MLPAPGQGALAVECLSAAPTSVPPRRPRRRRHPGLRRGRARPARLLEAGCSAPVGALAEIVEGESDDGRTHLELSLRAFVGTVDGSDELRRSLVGDPADPHALAHRLYTLLMEDGAAELMSTPELSQPESLENVP
jgi:hydroxymethylbilane synthase